MRPTSAAAAVSPAPASTSRPTKANTWTKIGDAEFAGKGIGAIVVKPGDSNTIYAGTTTALRGYSSSCCSGVTRPVPGAAKWGLYKTTNGGAYVELHPQRLGQRRRLHRDRSPSSTTPATCSPRGVRNVELDPCELEHRLRVLVRTRCLALERRRRHLDADQAVSQRGASSRRVRRSTSTCCPTARLACTSTKGNTGNASTSRLFRSDDVATGAPAFTDLTSPSPADRPAGRRTTCAPAQCWYDMFVETPKGHPDIVYVGGSYSYGETGRQQARRDPLDRCRRQRHRHDLRRDRPGAAARAPSRPARHRQSNPQQPVPSSSRRTTAA